MASLVYESENCLAEEHINIGINKGEQSFHSAEFRNVSIENREMRQLIDQNKN